MRALYTGAGRDRLCRKARGTRPRLSSGRHSLAMRVLRIHVGRRGRECVFEPARKATRSVGGRLGRDLASRRARAWRRLALLAFAALKRGADDMLPVAAFVARA